MKQITRERISAKLKGRKLSPQHRAKIAESLRLWHQQNNEPKPTAK